MKPQAPADLWAQLDAITGPPVRVDDIGKSANEYAERHGISPKRSREILKTLVSQGKLLVGYRRNSGGNKIKVYRPK